jgi:hypothetical protein
MNANKLKVFVFILFIYRNRNIHKTPIHSLHIKATFKNLYLKRFQVNCNENIFASLSQIYAHFGSH